ncbi:unnamed protein product, partial [Chrysoparadoxa australica]
MGPRYEMLCGHSLQASHNAVFVHRALLPLLGNVRSAAVATGLGTRTTKLGNKGGIGIAFSIGATECIFVNAHFAAHQNNASARNEHYRQIESALAQQLCQKPGGDPLPGETSHGRLIDKY